MRRDSSSQGNWKFKNHGKSNAQKHRKVGISGKYGEHIIIHDLYIIYWLVVGPPLWRIWKSIGMIRNSQYFWENKIDGNQTTNQYIMYNLNYTILETLFYLGLRLLQPVDFQMSFWQTESPSSVGSAHFAAAPCGHQFHLRSKMAIWISTRTSKLT